MFNGQLRSRHWGLDIDGRLGDPILAMGDGTVVMVAERYYSGGTLVIDHGLRLFSLYFHLSEFAVKPGERVARGQLIGRVGSTGRSTGPHLHLTTKLEDRSFDPTALLEMDLREDDDPAVADEDRPAP
jgi:murein DD-endopeptidase MepM/ murein hydrolase activator NlpD